MSQINTGNDLYATLGLTAQSPEPKKSNQLGMEDFMKLMVTELTYQDPMKPMDNAQLATQISQFATVTGIDELNKSFSTLSGSLTSDQALQAANLVGRDVLISSPTAWLETGGSIEGNIQLPDSANNVVVRITNSQGVLVRELNLGIQKEGDVLFKWDGSTDIDEYAAPGAYQISAEATVNDETVAPATLVRAQVDSVNLGASGQPLTLNLHGLGLVPVSDVSKIY